ncbi:MAG: hypothetical protein EO766_11700 [Hydrotalea sp. AMD]|uniref:hypothetical protein n=1 Tax=Hydrotalea sp. AMD TaxID=2501297 RepID=UPI0010266569|nr:hypothetical protein [Hydrotalea sp. AMD]RWZ87190.1 MAG: hypothetical protein EO766_11700 [Hydrotalea sp. AMD]
MNNKVTAFNNIFEGRIQKLIKQIKELRKKKGNLELIKGLLKEAKHIRSKMKKVEKKKKQPCYFITIDKDISSRLIECSPNIHITSVSETDNEITIRFIKGV